MRHGTADPVKGLPLSGVRVLDLTWVVSGPQTTRLLADLGAEVVKMESRQHGDQVRRMTFNPHVWRARGMFIYFNRNKLGISLNMATSEGRAIFGRLVSLSDVVIENFSARVMERWGFDYAHLAAINPAIIYVSMPGFGHSGPQQDYQSNGPTIQALAGQTFACGLPGLPPTGFGYSYMDHTAGYYGAMAALQALYYRNRTGRGQFVDLAQLETACSLMGTYILDYTANGRSSRRPGMPQGNRSAHPAGAPHGVYRCLGDDRWVVITVFTEEEWGRFREAIGAPAWTADPRFATLPDRLRNQDDLDGYVESWTAQRTQSEVMRLLQGAGVAAGMVQDPSQRADEDPQLRARGHIVDLEMAEAEGGRARVDGLPMAIASLPHESYRPAPTVGEHNSRIYGDLLGMGDLDIEDCFKREVF